VYTITARPIISIVPSKFIECTKSTVTLTASGAGSYTWSGSGTGNNSTLTFPTGTVAGNYSFTASGVSPLTGCVGSGNISILISDCVGLSASLPDGNELRVYPNPFNNSLSISGLAGHIEVYTMLGQLLVTTTIEENTTSINTSEFVDGIYFIKAFSTSGKNVKTLKLIKN
jgi:hypothetical protein